MSKTATLEAVEIPGHSSHHVRPIEVYHGKLVLYGCGDLIEDYEGISEYEQYRDDLGAGVLPIAGSGHGAAGDAAP
jgi:poly-gamma-glutamate capsule biosynthesis protein CapA/YwtB (metallophosphatase superfamily)